MIFLSYSKTLFYVISSFDCGGVSARRAYIAGVFFCTSFLICRVQCTTVYTVSIRQRLKKSSTSGPAHTACQTLWKYARGDRLEKCVVRVNIPDRFIMRLSAIWVRPGNFVAENWYMGWRWVSATLDEEEERLIMYEKRFFFCQIFV